MSGIAAVIRFDDGPPARDRLQTMIAAAPHRAPDGAGTWTGGSAALAKLHRLTLPAQRPADQPAFDPRGAFVVIFDGRLDAAGGGDDAHVVLDAVERGGGDALARLEGDFACAAWNRRTRTLVAARDRLGTRPLYWAKEGPTLLLATDLAQVLAAMTRAPGPDETAVSDLLAFEPAADERTLYGGVQRVPAGHLLVVDSNGARMRRYWAPEPGVADEGRSDDDYAEECRTLLRRAVGARLRASTPPVVFFSGGIDSSAVLATALELCRDTGRVAPRPLSLQSDAPESDERAYRRAFAAAHGVAIVDVPPGALDPAAYADQAAARALPPDLPADFIGRPLLWRARDIGARVALTGAGGDDLFSGSTLHYADLIRRGRVPAAVARYWRDRTTDDSGWTPLGLLTGGVWPLLPCAIREAIRRPVRRALRMTGPPAWVRLPRPDRRAVPDPPRGISHANWDLCWNLRNGWTATLIESNERMMAAAGVEPRYPLYDPAMIRFALALPERQRRRDRVTKYVLRGAARLPTAIAERRTKADFGYVILDALQALGGARFFADLQIAETGWVDPEAARWGYDRARARTDWRDEGAGHLLPRLWILAAVELWYRARFGTPPRPLSL